MDEIVFLADKFELVEIERLEQPTLFTDTVSKFGEYSYIHT